MLQKAPMVTGIFSLPTVTFPMKLAIKTSSNIADLKIELLKTFVVDETLTKATKIGLRTKITFSVRVLAHFTVMRLVTWPWIGSEARGDLVLIQTSLLFIYSSCCSYAN